MRIKTWKAILGAAMMAAVLTACGGSGVTGESSGRAESGAKETAAEKEVSAYGDKNGVKIQLWTFADVHAAFYGKMVEDWNQSHPDKTISFTATTYPYDEMHNKYIMSLQAGTGAPDLVDVEVSKYPNFVAGLDKWLYPLNEAAAPYMADMVLSRMQTYQGSDGNYYGAPFHVGATVMYYNLAELEKHGITQADIDAVVTWDDYGALGEKYKNAVTEEGTYWTTVDTGGVDWLWLAMAEYGEDYTGGFEDPANVEIQSVRNMLNMQVDWLEKGIAGISPGPHLDQETGYQALLDHKIMSFPKAMWYMSRFTNYMPEEKGNWYIAKCPVFEEGQPASVGIGGTGTVVSASSPNKELAAEFICWAKMSKEGELAIWNDLGFDVCNTAMWTDPSFADDESNQYNTYFRNKPYHVLTEIAGSIGKISVVAISPVINEQMNNITLNDIFEDKVPVDEALAAAQTEIDLEQ